MKLAPWNGTDIALLLQLQAQGPGCWRNAFGDPNKNGRAYGGQLLGQALMAGLLEAPADRPPSMMQFLFLQEAEIRAQMLLDGVDDHGIASDGIGQ